MIETFQYKGQARTSDDKFILQWRLTDDVIDFKAEVVCTGWIGVGFSPGSKFHSHSDSFQGFVDDNTGEVHWYDGMSSSIQAKPENDASNDFTILDAAQENGKTIIVFSRKLESGDERDLALVTGKQTIAWSYHQTRDVVTTEHTESGTWEVNLFDGSSVTAVGDSFIDNVGVILVVVVFGLLVVLPVLLRCFRAFKGEEIVEITFMKKRVKWAEIQWIDALNIALVGALGLVLPFIWDNPELADSFGMVACAYSFMAVIPATRNSILTLLIEVPFERTVVYHRWIGRFTFLASGTHGLMHAVQWTRQGILIDNLFYTQKYSFGFIALTSLALVYFTSIEFIRRRYYQFFRWVHYSFVFFFIFGALHATEFLKYAIAAGVFYVIDLALRYRFGTLVSISAQVTVLAGDVARIRFDKSPGRNYAAGQYVFLNFPQINARQWHPYSLTSGPHAQFLEVHVKALGNHTNRLISKAGMNLEIIEEGSMPVSSLVSKVKVDGPYGRIGKKYMRHSTVILVAGGIGITPLISVIKGIYRIGLSQAQRENEHAAPRNSIKTVVLIWVIPTTSYYTWFKTVIEEAKAISDESKGYPRLEVHLFISRSVDNEAEFDRMHNNSVQTKGFSVTRGRPVIAETMRELQLVRTEKAAVLACGPKKLINSTWDFCTKKRKGDDVTYEFHQETFNF